MFVWVGKTSQVEDYANEKLDQLVEALGVDCSRTREVQEHESKVFTGFFKQGLQYVILSDHLLRLWVETCLFGMCTPLLETLWRF